MTEMSCPACQAPMDTIGYGDLTVRRCEACSGLFLAATDLGALIEAETDWHAHRSANTAAMPRITSQMTAPPQLPTPSRSFLEALFTA